MQRVSSLVGVLVVGCTSSAPTEKAAKVDEAKPVDVVEKNVETAKPTALPPASGATPVFVTLGRTGSRTSKPVANALLAHSWGWGSASTADQTACEAKASSPGQLMACATEAKPEGAAELLAELDLAPSSSTFVRPEQIAGWKIAAPAGPVWLFGPTQACKATVGRPLVGWYSIEGGVDEGGEEGTEPPKPDLGDDFTILELAWELTGCEEADETWAPIGMAADEFDATARWVPMKAGERQRFDPATWNGALVSEVAKLSSTAKPPEDAEPAPGEPEWSTQTFELPGTEIREIYFAAVWRGVEGSKPPGDYSCMDSELVEVFQMRSANMIGRSSRGKLVGALVIGPEAHSLVWTDSLDYQVAPLGPAGLGDSVELSTGVYHPEGGGDPTYTLLPYCGP